MRVSRVELDQLIKEEINEIFGFGKEAPKEYPADEMVYLLSRLFAIASKVGITPDDDVRQTIVKEIEDLLAEEGYELHEQLEFGGNVEFALTGGKAPKLLDLIKDTIAKDPAAADLITRLFKRSAINPDIEFGSLATLPQTSPAPSAPVAPPDDEECPPGEVLEPETDTCVEPEVGEPPSDQEEPEEDPEDLKATDKVPAVVGPGQEEPAEEDTPLSDEECAELFDIDDPDIKKVLDRARADSTIRGKVASIGRDLSLTMDAVTIGALGVTATGVGAVPGAAVATGAATASVVGSAIAVAMDLLNGQFKQAAIDSIGLIPMGSGVGKAGREVGEVAAKEAAQQAAKSAGRQAGKRALAKSGEKAAAKASASAAKNAQASIQAVVKGAAKAPAAIESRLVKMMVDKGVDETMAKVLAPMMMKKAQGKLQAKLAENMEGMPSRDDYKNEKEYAKATKNYYLQRREQSASIMSRCMKSQDSEAAKTAKKFLDAVHDWVDDVPRWFSAAVKGVMGLFADEDEEAAPSPRPRFGQAGKKLRRPDQIGPMREQKELDRMKVLAGVK
jgi:hypothetical protein